MLCVLASVPLPFLGIPKPVFPWIIDIAEARQRQITAKLQEAEQARGEADARLKEADSKLVEARKTADAVIEGANRSGEQLRADLRQKADLEYQRIVDSASRDIEVERERALQGARDQVAGLVVAATEKVTADPQVAAVLSNPTIATEHREALVATAPHLIDEEATNLARLLIESGRIDEVQDVDDEFQRLADEAAGRVRATVTTAIELEAADR